MHKTGSVYLTFVLLLCIAACVAGGSPEMAYANQIQTMIDLIRIENEKYGKVMTDPERTLDERRKAADEMAAKVDQLMIDAAKLEPPAGCAECSNIQTELQNSLNLPINIRMVNWKVIQLAVQGIALKYGEASQE